MEVEEGRAAGGWVGGWVGGRTYHGAEGGGGGEEGAVDDEDVDVLGLDAGFVEDVLDGTVDHGLGFFPCPFLCLVGGEVFVV